MDNKEIQKLLTHSVAIIIGTLCMLLLVKAFGFEEGVIAALGFIFAKLILNDLEKNE